MIEYIVTNAGRDNAIDLSLCIKNNQVSIKPALLKDQNITIYFCISIDSIKQYGYPITVNINFHYDDIYKTYQYRQSGIFEIQFIGNESKISGDGHLSGPIVEKKLSNT